jgi:hypothetical protein
MEIGFLPEQMIDIGLNIAGFISAGALLILIWSLLSSRKEKPLTASGPEVSSEIIMAGRSSEQIVSDQSPKVEYINLKGVNWNPKKENRFQRMDNNSAAPNRRRIIGVAQKTLSNTGKVNHHGSVKTKRSFEGIRQAIRKGTGR